MKKKRHRRSADSCKMQFYDRSATFYSFVTLQLNWFGPNQDTISTAGTERSRFSQACHEKPEQTGGQLSSHVELAWRPPDSRCSSIIMKAHRFGAREVMCAFLVPGAFGDILAVTLQPFVWNFPDKHSFTGGGRWWHWFGRADGKR